MIGWFRRHHFKAIAILTGWLILPMLQAICR